ncbi:MAG: hypothetical protein STSR0008_10240 [Ignavibacterium sp.]
MNENKFILPTIILSIALLFVAVIVTQTWSSNYKSNQTITVTGSAKKDIVSDLGILRGTITTRSFSSMDAYKMLQSQKPILLSYFEKNGFPKDKVIFYTINSYPVYEISSTGNQTNNIIGYIYNQRVEIQSNDVNKIKEISLDIASLIEKGVSINIEMPEYHYTKIANLKVDTQAEASKDAMNRAQKIADATGRKLGPLRTARMGVIQITPKNSNLISDYGINDLSSIEKEITAVVSASFSIE